MCEQAVIASLAVVGLICELGGLWLITREIRSDRDAARAAAEGSSDSDLTLTVGMSLTMPYNIEGREPTLEERLERVEERVAGLAEREHRVRDELQDYVNQKISHVEKAAVGRDEALRRFLSDLLEGSLRQRRVGVALFAVGATLAAASSVWGALV